MQPDDRLGPQGLPARHRRRDDDGDPQGGSAGRDGGRPEDGELGLVSPDGRRVVVWAGIDRPVIYGLDGGGPQAVPSASEMDWPIRWSPDGTSLLVLRGRSGQISGALERVDLLSGKREIVREFAPPERAGLLLLASASVSADGKSHAYSFFRMRSTLYLVEGAR